MERKDKLAQLQTLPITLCQFLFCFVDVSTLWFRCKSVPLPHFTKIFTFFCQCKKKIIEFNTSDRGTRKYDIANYLHFSQTKPQSGRTDCCAGGGCNLQTSRSQIWNRGRRVSLTILHSLHFAGLEIVCQWLYYTVHSCLQGFRLCVRKL